MKKIVNILLIAVVSSMSLACSEDIMDEINKDVNSALKMQTRFTITNLMLSTPFRAASDYAFYASVYIEHAVGTWNQTYQAEQRINEPASASTYNNSWNSQYRDMHDLLVVIEKCSQGGDEEGNYHTLGIAQILLAYNLAQLTDLMGDVPWSEACQPGEIFSPKIDKQQDIYNDIMKLLDDGIANLGRTTTFLNLGTQDLLYGGNASRWIKAGYGLKARSLMRLSLKSPKYADVLAAINLSFANATEEMRFNYNGSTTRNPFARFYTDRQGHLSGSRSMREKLLVRNDPRKDVFWVYPAGGGLDVLANFPENGNSAQDQVSYARSALSSSTYAVSGVRNSAPTFMMSYHELLFLKAEAHVRLNQIAEAEAALKQAVIAAFAQINNITGGLTPAMAENYFENEVKPLFDANPLSEVMTQKYLSFFECEAIEAYNDYRRCKAMGDAWTNGFLKNPLQFPLRFTYGQSDVNTNSNVNEAFGNGQYVYNENVWWAGGNR
ncbi:MAG: SusD/RagB family nutrient-binding outer membrane lipoprotein [Bacteroidales bacterium]|nr:SusD/RagB family nutrient-binding outer membrane lipoprotein [Bacteroidales bacterium]